jgi:fumarylacetoacetate (FAA) hydrolase
MKLGTLRNGSRDGELVVVRRDLARAARASHIAPTMQAALDDWERAEPALRRARGGPGARARRRRSPSLPSQCRAPLPRAYEWVDGSAFLNHVVLVRQARGGRRCQTRSSYTDPLVYQGGSGVAPRADRRHLVWCPTPRSGLDFESEVCRRPRRHAARDHEVNDAEKHVCAW